MSQENQTNLVQRVPRNLEEPARIFGLAPMELATSALIYAGASTLLRGIPFSSFLALGVGVGFAVTLFILNRTKPPLHGVFWLLAAVRKPITPVMPFGKENQ